MSDKVFKALGDPTRRMILRSLNDGDKTAGEISKQFDTTDATLSHHLSVLKDADLVWSRADGQKRIYSLNTTVLQDVVVLIMDVFGDKPEVQTE